MPNYIRRRSPRIRTATSTLDVVIVLVGLVLAAASSVAAYRLVGPYGDGPINVRLYRSEDPETGLQLVYRDVPKKNGTVQRYLFDDTTRTLRQIQVRRVVDGKVEVVGVHIADGALTRLDTGGETVARDGNDGALKVGFSLRGNGIIDAWAYRDAAGQLVKVEVSLRQDGRIDRWEFYKDDQLARVEEDENRDGRVDRWLTYDAGILVSEARDRNGDGKPD